MLVAKARRPVTIWLLGFGLVALLAMLIVATRHPALTAEDQRLVGWWGGLDARNPAVPYVWLSEVRADHTLRIYFRHFQEFPMFDGKGDARGNRWIPIRTVEEQGIWRVEDGVHITDTWAPAQDLSLARKLRWLLTNKSWPKNDVFHGEYVIDRLDAHELEQHLADLGFKFRSLRGTAGLELPSQPLPPEQWVK